MRTWPMHTYLTQLWLGVVLVICAACGGANEPIVPSSRPFALVITPNVDTMFETGALQFVARVTNADGEILSSDSVSWWTHDATRMSVTQQGVVTARALGTYTATIFAGVQGVADTATVWIIPRPVASIVLHAPLAMLAGESLTVRVTLFDSVGAILPPRPLNWSTSDSAIAFVNASGQVFANRSGAATISVTSGHGTASALMTTIELAFDSVAAGEGHTCGLATDHHVWCWGDNRSLQLGGSAVGSAVAAPSLADTTLYQSIAAGGHHTCGIALSGILNCWGANEFGQAGSPVSPVISPRPVPTAPAFVRVKLGGRHSCGLTAAGSLYCWGDNGLGQLGLGDTVQRSTPTLVSFSGGVLDFALGGEHTCALSTSNVTYCWGARTSSQFSAVPASPCYDTDYCVSPTIADSVPLLLAIDGQSASVCGLDSGSALWCWGGGFGTARTPYPQMQFASFFWDCGIDYSHVTYCIPGDQNPVPGNHSFHIIAPGAARCGLEQHRIWCWGWNDIYYLLGNYEPFRSDTPLLIIGHAR